MLKKDSLLLVLLLGLLALTAESKKTTDVSELLKDVSAGFNKVRDNAENKASELVSQIEQSKVFGNINGTVSELVTTIFKGYNIVVDKAEMVAKDVVHKLESELKADKKEVSGKVRLKRNLESNIDNLKNKTVHLANKIANITEHLKISDKITGMFDMILNNLEHVITKINGKIMQAIDESTEKETDKDNAFKVTEIDSKKRAQTTTAAPAAAAANDKYKKMADFYKKKYAGNFVYDPAAEEGDKSEKKAQRRRRSVDEDDEEEEEAASDEDEEEAEVEETTSKTNKNKNPFKLKDVDSKKYKEQYRQAGKEFAASLRNLTLELLDELFDDKE